MTFLQTAQVPSVLQALRCVATTHARLLYICSMHSQAERTLNGTSCGRDCADVACSTTASPLRQLCSGGRDGALLCTKH